MQSIRRRRVDYSLPSESPSIFDSIVGKKLLKFGVGVRKHAVKDAETEAALNLESPLYRYQGGPFFLSFERGRTVVLYDDDCLGSIVLKEVAQDVEAVDFLEILEDQDCLGERNRIRQIVDLDQGLNLLGRSVVTITVFKLPDNFWYSPNGYDMLNDCALSFDFGDNVEILFVSQLREEGRFADIRVSEWAKLNGGDVAQLRCIMQIA